MFHARALFGVVSPLRRALGRDETGATAVEYGVLVALIIAVVIVIVINLGQELLPGFEAVNSGLDAGGT